MDAYFPYVRTVRRSSELPWINSGVHKRIKQRRAIYKREGRSAKWKRMKKVADNIIKTRRKNYMDYQRLVLLEEDSERCFFKNIKIG